MSNSKGMDTIQGQEKDRQNWHRSIEKRNKLVEELKSLNIPINRPHEMKMIELEALVNKHRKTVENKKNKWEYMSYLAIANAAGIRPGTLNYRLSIGMTLEEALLKPTHRRSVNEELTTEQIAIAERNGISRKMLSSRLLELDWSVDDAITLPKGTRRSSLKVEQDDEEMELNMTKEERRALRRQKQNKRLQLLDKINELEVNGANKEQIKSLEKELANI